MTRGAHRVNRREVGGGWNHVVNRGVLVLRGESDISVVGATPWGSVCECRNVGVRVGRLRFRLVGGELYVAGLIDRGLGLNIGGVADDRDCPAHAGVKVTEIGERCAWIAVDGDEPV